MFRSLTVAARISHSARIGSAIRYASDQPFGASSDQSFGTSSNQSFSASTRLVLFAKELLGVEFLYENDGFAQRVAFV